MTFEKETKRTEYFKQLEKELQELIDPNTRDLSPDVSQVVTCPLCGSDEYEVVFKKRGYTFVRCISCGLVFTNPQVLKEKVEELYASALSNELWMEVLLSEAEKSWRYDYFKDNLLQIQRFVSRGRLLDVGCAMGQFMQIAKEGGWEVMGLELSNKAYQYVRNVLGLPVLQSTLEEASFEDNEFDAVTLFGILEHVPNPVEILTEAVRIVKPGGIIAVFVPNVYSLATMILREKTATFDGRNHLIYFSMQTLQTIFHRVSLQILLKDTLLTALPNIIRYIQFYEPYGAYQGLKFLPEKLQHLISNQQPKIEKFISQNDLGLRIRMYGRK